MRSIIAIDCETGGLDETKHALLSVGLVELDENYNPVRLKEVFIKAILQVQSEAAKINGYSAMEWNKNGALPLWDALKNIFLWLPGEFDFIAHNAQFDRKFFEFSSKDCMDKFGTGQVKDVIGDPGWICTKKLYQSIAGDPCNLNVAAVKVGHWPEDYSRKVHGALIDALACAAVYKWCKKQQVEKNAVVVKFYEESLMSNESNQKPFSFDAILDKLK